MSKEFYKYLAKRTVEYFISEIISSGNKYILKFDNKNDVEAYYNALDEVLDEEYDNIKTKYIAKNDDDYETIGFSTKETVNLFVVPELNITNAYMTRLRNTVQDNWAMLIVAHSPIDSIAGGTESLQKEGMPFHRDKLISDIHNQIEKSDLSDAIKQMLLFDLDSKKNAGYMDSYSIGDYAEIIKVLSNGTIDRCEFKDFLLFYDEDVCNMIPAENIKERITDNNKLYKKINDSVRFGNPDHDLSKDFSDDFINKIKDNAVKKEHWDDGITYSDVKKSQRKKEKGELPLQIEKISIFSDGSVFHENRDYYVKSEAEKGAKFNRKHILIFNSNHASDFEIEISFSDTIKKNDITIIDEKIDTGASTSGRKLTIKHNHADVSINRVDLKCKERTDNFQFSFCIINCSPSWFKSVSTLYMIDAKPQKKRPKSLIINCNSEIITFNPNSEYGETIALENDTAIVYDDNKFYKLIVSENSFNDENYAYATLAIGDNILNILFREESPQNVSCSGIKIEQKKLFAKQNFIYHGENKLSLGTNEYNTQGELKSNLILEEFIVKNRILSCTFYSNESIEPIELKVIDDVRNAYLELLNYCAANDTLPSLIYYGEEFCHLAINYINSIFRVLSELEENKPLSKAQEDVLRIGVVDYPEKNMIAYSPFHPLNVAYQILLTNESSNMKIEIREDILKKLCSDNLMPMIRNEKGELCRILEQKHSPQWTYYYKADIKKNNGSRDFVSVIVKEKILEFYNHFKYLFGNIGGNKMIINAVNMGDCHNLFKGIINYYKEQLNHGESPELMLTIIVNIYNDDKIYNVFDCLAHKPLLKRFLNEIGIKENKNEFSDSELINCLVSNIKYFRKGKDDKNYEYCHISFIEMDQETNEGFSNHTDIRSGTMLEGLLSGVSSTYYGQSHSYRTGYGSRFNMCNNTSDNILKLADYYNSAMYVFAKNNPYSSSNVLCTYIDEKETEMIEKTYDSSNWVVFIDPKVDLNFFKNTDKDIMIIHYSDQHTTSSGYDAITVTRKTEQYANILKEYLADNNLTSGNDEHIRNMIDMFNAVNGDWLLKLISSSDKFSKEKISIQSAIKLALAFYKCDYITWIPISLEEILRVSGSVGLSQKGGLFSAKNLGYESGATSDDLLMFGVENRNGQVYVHLYPLEVKIGYKNTDELPKATEQIQKTKKIFDQYLTSNENENTLQNKFYRNFIAQLAVISAEKLNLYNVWSGQDWEMIVNTDVRGKLLNDDFIVSNELYQKIGDGIIISFKDGAFMRSVIKNEVTVLKFLYDDGIDFLTKSVDEIVDSLQKMNDISGQLFKQINIEEKSIDQTENIQNTIDETSPVTSEEKFDNSNGECNDTPIDIVQLKESITEEKSPEGMKILFGHDVNTKSPIYWYPNNTEKVMHPNTGIIGTMGTGKTQFTKSLILQLMREQKNNPGDEPLGILIFDYKGDYNNNKQDFVDATNAKVYDLYHLPFNPFSITVTPTSKPMLPMHIASTFRETLSTAYNLGAKQEATLIDCIMQAYANRGIDKLDKNTWTKTAPVLRDVLNIFQSRDTFKEDSLYSALSELDRFEIFETDPNKTMPLYDLINGVTVINLQGYDPYIQNLVVAITLDLFYSQMQVNGHSLIDGNLRQLRKFVLVDEADNFLKLGFSSIRKILKEGREFGVGTILSTQFLKHFDTQQDDFSKYILSWIVHKVDDLSSKDVKNLFNPESKSMEDELISSIKKLSKHCSFVKLGDSTAPYYMMDRAFWEIIKNEKGM